MLVVLVIVVDKFNSFYSSPKNSNFAHHGHPFPHGYGYGNMNAGGFSRIHFLNFRRLDKMKR